MFSSPLLPCYALAFVTKGASRRAALGTHVVLSEFIDGDLGLHEVVVEDDDFSAEGSLFLLVVVGLRRRQEREDGQSGREKVKFKCEYWQMYECASVCLSQFILSGTGVGCRKPFPRMPSV